MSIEPVVLYFLSPLPTALWVAAAAGVCRALGRRRAAVVLAAAAFAFLWICSTPWVARTLQTSLESRYTPLAPQAMPGADAILVLGGAVSGAKPPERPTLQLGSASTRVWYAAALYRAGKARRVVVAAGNRPEYASEQIEANAIAELLMQLGVPGTAIETEGASRTTRENARNVLPLLERLGARRVLLVTSATHMPRAMRTFRKIWGPGGPQLIPAVTDVKRWPDGATPLELWLPSLEALSSVTKSLKEFAGMAALAIMM